MKLTTREKDVVDKLREWKVATKKKLCDYFHISHMTVVRALNKFGYYTSYNKNSAFYTLHNTPKFDTYGLWVYNDICFSRHVTLEDTIISIIEDSDSGFTSSEIKKILKTEVKNILSRLCRQKRLSRHNLGRFVLYLSHNQKQAFEQKTCREKKIEELQEPRRLEKHKTKLLPEKMDSITVIKILVRMIEYPKASEASISQALQRQGVSITAKEVRSVIAFYSLKKKWVQ